MVLGARECSQQPEQHKIVPRAATLLAGVWGHWQDQHHNAVCAVCACVVGNWNRSNSLATNKITELNLGAFMMVSYLNSMVSGETTDWI